VVWVWLGTFGRGACSCGAREVAHLPGGTSAGAPARLCSPLVRGCREPLAFARCSLLGARLLAPLPVVIDLLYMCISNVFIFSVVYVCARAHLSCSVSCIASCACECPVCVTVWRVCSVQCARVCAETAKTSACSKIDRLLAVAARRSANYISFVIPPPPPTHPHPTHTHTRHSI